jgi:uncharacterized protein (TIGR02145 family)
MNRSGLNIIKLVSVVFVVILSVKCDKTENSSQNNDPCGSHLRSLLCIPVSPSNGAYVSPVDLTIKWIGHGSATSSLYFGTDRDKLQRIFQQNAQSFVLKDLDMNTKYYWYVTGELQCYYGCSTGIYSFTTVPDINLPFVITSPVFTHINTPPRVGGNVMYEGSSKLYECGIYYGLSSNPENGGTKLRMNDSPGLFSDLLPGLNSNTAYYVKAYATNNSGTVFGSEVTFTTGQASNYKSVKDIEGNIYYAINIGNQVWMAENLKSTVFNDGTPIPNVTDDNTWTYVNTPAYCWYNNNPGYKNTYGALYNWYTIDSAGNGHRNVCPAGWHVPGDNEWATLTEYLGGAEVAGTKLKETGDYYWRYPSPAGDNSSDFSALPGGLRYERSSGTIYSTPFYLMETNALWWSITSSPGNHWLEVASRKSSADKYPSVKNEGHSIRCIKDS